MDNYVTWHARLGHIGQERMNELAREGLLGQLAKVSLPNCEHCLSGKSTRKPSGKATYFITFIEYFVMDFICL